MTFATTKKMPELKPEDYGYISTGGINGNVENKDYKVLSTTFPTKKPEPVLTDGGINGNVETKEKTDFLDKWKKRTEDILNGKLPVQPESIKIPTIQKAEDTLGKKKVSAIQKRKSVFEKLQANYKDLGMLKDKSNEDLKLNVELIQDKPQEDLKLNVELIQDKAKDDLKLNVGLIQDKPQEESVFSKLTKLSKSKQLSDAKKVVLNNLQNRGR